MAPDPDPSVAIEIRGLVKTYGTVQAVNGIDLTVRRGEVFAFLGPNGAGKTTTVEILEGIRPRTAGEVRVLGRDPWGHSADLLRQVGVIPQDFSFFDKITPKEGVEFYATLFGHRVDAQALLRKVGVDDKANATFDDLSGGQKRKLGLALALVNDPQLLFLDEPTTGLDPQARRALWEVIRELKKDGRTVFLTTHYLEEAEVLADRVAILLAGKVIALGTPEEIIRTHGRPEVIEFEAPAELAQALEQGSGRRVQVLDGRVCVEVSGPADMVRIVNLAAQSGIPWKRLTTRSDTLEEVFLRLVGPTPTDAPAEGGTK